MNGGEYEAHGEVRRANGLPGDTGLGMKVCPGPCDHARILVLGFDTDLIKVERLRSHRSHIGHVSDIVARIFERGFEPTADFDRLGEPDVIIICVPTPLTETREPDLGFVVQSARDIAARLRLGQPVVLESTT